MTKRRDIYSSYFKYQQIMSKYHKLYPRIPLKELTYFKKIITKNFFIHFSIFFKLKKWKKSFPQKKDIVTLLRRAFVYLLIDY